MKPTNPRLANKHTKAPKKTLGEFIIENQNAIPAPLNYKGFPKSVCTTLPNATLPNTRSTLI